MSAFVILTLLSGVASNTADCATSGRHEAGSCQNAGDMSVLLQAKVGLDVLSGDSGNFEDTDKLRQNQADETTMPTQEQLMKAGNRASVVEQNDYYAEAKAGQR